MCMIKDWKCFDVVTRDSLEKRDLCSVIDLDLQVLSVFPFFPVEFFFLSGQKLRIIF